MSANSKIKILFFTPFSGYTGSEVMLFSMLRHMDMQKFEIAVFSMEKGELLDTLPHNIPRYYYKSNKGILYKIKNKFLDLVTGTSDLERQIMQIHGKHKSGIWYLNTMLHKKPMEVALKHKIKYAVHFHELLSAYKYLTASEMQKMVGGALFTVGCCESVCNNLRILGADIARKQYECFDSALVKVDREKKQFIREKLKIPAGHKVIIMSGLRENRKGIDLFIGVANELRDKPYFFLWLGASRNSGEEFFFEKYIAFNKMANINLLHPSREEYYNYLDLADVFFLSSREDPFPLVMLEASYLGKYIIALNSGGVKEFLNEDTGHTINSWNIPDIANELHHYMKTHPEAMEDTKGKEQALKFDVLNQVKLFEELLIAECPH